MVSLGGLLQCGQPNAINSHWWLEPLSGSCAFLPPPLKGGRRHQGVSPFIINMQLFSIFWIENHRNSSSLPIPTSTVSTSVTTACPAARLGHRWCRQSATVHAKADLRHRPTWQLKFIKSGVKICVKLRKCLWWSLKHYEVVSYHQLSSITM